jgi:hypothetical protein
VADAQEVEELVWQFPASGTQGRQAGPAEEVALSVGVDGDELAIVLWFEEGTQALVVEALAALC